MQCFILFEIKPWVQENGAKNVMMIAKLDDVPNLILVRRQLVGLVHQWMFHRHHQFQQEIGMTGTGVNAHEKDRIDLGKEIAKKGIEDTKKRKLQEGDMKRVQTLQNVQEIDDHCQNIELIVTVSSSDWISFCVVLFCLKHS